MDHLTYGQRMFALIARGEHPGTRPSPEERAKDHLGEDPAASYSAASAELRDAFRQPNFLDGTYPTPIGEQRGAGLVQMRVTEQLVHGWDIARATGQVPQFSDATVQMVLDGLRQRMVNFPRADGGPFKPEQPADPGATPIDQLAAFLGRSA